MIAVHTTDFESREAHRSNNDEYPLATTDLTTTVQLSRWERGLAAQFPVIGWMRRRLARCGRAARREDPRVVRLVVPALRHQDERTARDARTLLESLATDKARDALCDEAIRAPHGRAAQICLRAGWRPTEEERECLFLFVTGQLDTYFAADYEFQNLRLEYERADDLLRRHILRVLRSGDRRCVRFFAQRKALAECNNLEIQVALRSFLKHRDWPRLFQAFLDLPLKYGLPVLRQLAGSGWLPPEPETRSLLSQAILDLGDLIPPSPRSAPAASPIFEEWLERGRQGTRSTRPVDELMEELEACSPVEGVEIVGALASRVSPGSEAASSIQNHPHWVIRLAGFQTNICVPLEQPELKDPVYWVERIAPEHPVLQLPPGKATPALLEALASTPKDGWRGPIGTARKILQQLMAYRITTGTFEKLVVEANVDDGEFELMTEADIESPSPGASTTP